jgi:sulfide:quinone oxidoreductase
MPRPPHVVIAGGGIAVAEAFGAAPVRRYPLDSIAADAEAKLLRDGVTQVSAPFSAVHLAGGGKLLYDELLVAVGAHRVPAVPGAVTFTGPDDVAAARAVLDGDEARNVAFVVPPGPSWPLPAYELALQAAAGSREVALLTAEPAPVAAFAPAISTGITGLPAADAVSITCGAAVTQSAGGSFLVRPGGPPIAAGHYVTAAPPSGAHAEATGS